MFEYQNIKTKKGDWNIVKAELDIQSDLILRAVRQAREKVKYTIQTGQNGLVRNNKLKLENQFRGMIAEIYAVELLKTWLAKSKTKNWEVIRYDDVRIDDFKSPGDEYDIKLQNTGAQLSTLKIESRSSVTYNRKLTDGLNDLDIIGPYISKTKIKETYVDYYIRPLYHNLKEMKAEEFSDFLKKGLIDLYFVGGCSKQNLIEKGVYKTMNQSSTKYRCLPIVQGLDILRFEKKLLDNLKLTV